MLKTRKERPMAFKAAFTSAAVFAKSSEKRIICREAEGVRKGRWNGRTGQALR